MQFEVYAPCPWSPQQVEDLYIDMLGLVFSDYLWRA